MSKDDTWNFKDEIRKRQAAERLRTKINHAEDMLHGYDDETMQRHLDKARNDVEDFWQREHKPMKYSRFYPKFSSSFPKHTLAKFVQKAANEGCIRIMTTTKGSMYVFPNLEKFVLDPEYAWELAKYEERVELDERNADRRYKYQQKTGAQPRPVGTQDKKTDWDLNKIPDGWAKEDE